MYVADEISFKKTQALGTHSALDIYLFGRRHWFRLPCSLSFFFSFVTPFLSSQLLVALYRHYSWLQICIDHPHWLRQPLTFVLYPTPPCLHMMRGMAFATSWLAAASPLTARWRAGIAMHTLPRPNFCCLEYVQSVYLTYLNALDLTSLCFDR